MAVWVAGEFRNGFGESSPSGTKSIAEATRAGKMMFIDGGAHSIVTSHVDNTIRGILLALQKGVGGEAGVAPAGFEPAISALRGLRPRPLDDGAVVCCVGTDPTCYQHHCRPRLGLARALPARNRSSAKPTSATMSTGHANHWRW